jgi:hypothetical protein
VRQTLRRPRGLPRHPSRPDGGLTVRRCVRVWEVAAQAAWSPARRGQGPGSRRRPGSAASRGRAGCSRRA